MMTPLEITRLGSRGEGVIERPEGPIFVPFTLPGEQVLLDATSVKGDHALALEITRPHPERIAPICPYYGVCGGCAIQTWPWDLYAEWKESLVHQACTQAGVEVLHAAKLQNAHGKGRRRVVLHARQRENGMHVGFMQARAHSLVPITNCPVLDPEMHPIWQIGQAMANCLKVINKPFDMMFTLTLNGLACDLRGTGSLPDPLKQTLCQLAQAHDLAQLSLHGILLIELRPPLLQMGEAQVHLPPGTFLQATEAGENLLASLVSQAVEGARAVADLFAGIGTFALRLASTAEVSAFELSQPALQALRRGANHATGLRPISTQAQDLFRKPLHASQLAKYDAVVIDPPRAGASDQMQQLAASDVPTIVSVSCAPGTFARDARILQDAGYHLTQLTPVDQFLYSPHVEMVGVFKKEKVKKPKAKRRLLG